MLLVGAKQMSPLQITNYSKWDVEVTVGGRRIVVQVGGTANTVAPVGEMFSVEALDWDGGVPEPYYDTSKNINQNYGSFTITYPDDATYIQVEALWG